MSGHSKWSKIKHKKASTDAKRGREFSVVSKLITAAVQEGGSGDPSQNPRLRVVLEKAKAVNMPRANIKKATDKGLGSGGGASEEEILYEAYGPGGVGFMVKVLTDNRNRSSAEIKSIFDKSGGSMGGPGSAAFMFEREGEGFKVKIPASVSEGDRKRVSGLVETLEAREDVLSVFTTMV